MFNKIFSYCFISPSYFGYILPEFNFFPKIKSCFLVCYFENEYRVISPHRERRELKDNNAHPFCQQQFRGVSCDIN